MHISIRKHGSAILFTVNRMFVTKALYELSLGENKLCMFSENVEISILSVNVLTLVFATTQLVERVRYKNPIQCKK